MEPAGKVVHLESLRRREEEVGGWVRGAWQAFYMQIFGDG